MTLDGTGSSDPNTPPQTPLTYAWGFESTPNGSLATLMSANTVAPTFVPDVMGDYVLSLTVTNKLGLVSTPATVVVSTSNSPPVAEAGADQAVTSVGTSIQLDGSQSYDPDGDPIGYEWSFASVPEGSSAALSGPNTEAPTFVADGYGDYVATLVVSDFWTSSTPDTVTVSFANLKPVAGAGIGGSAIAGDSITLDGSASYDPNGDPLSYQWSLTTLPAGSLVGIADPMAVVTAFVPDLPGTYVAQLTVNDGYVDGDPSTVAWLVISKETQAITAVRAVEDALAGLPGSAFSNENHRKALINKLNAVIESIRSQRHVDAEDQIQNDILVKVDGCANSTPPAPDKQDWIDNCADQAQVYPLVIDAIQHVTGLL